MNILSFNNVKKRLGVKNVIKNVTLELKEGHVLGLLGQNGAGKTTLLKLAVGMLKADSGQIDIMGQPSWDMPNHVKERIGYVAQKATHFHWMKVQELLDYTGAFYQNWDSTKVKNLLNTWKLDPNANVAALSEGQQLRLSIIQSMGHSPDLLILDEPVASLDPIVRRYFIKQVIDMNIDKGTSVILSTHIMSDIERVAADVAILKEGELSYCGGLDHLKEKVVKLQLHAQGGLPQNLPFEHILHEARQANMAILTVTDFDITRIQQIEKDLECQIQLHTMNLEDIFLELHR